MPRLLVVAVAGILLLSCSQDGAAPGDVSGTTAGQVTDLGVARPGTWPVGDAGTVTFGLDGGRPALEGHEAAEGWDATPEEEDDGIAVDFSRDGVRWAFEAEADDDVLGVGIGQEHLDAEPGTYEIPGAGSFTFSRDNGTLTLDSIDLDGGWDTTDRDDDEDRLRFAAAAGDREVDVEVELDDGRVGVVIDYAVEGPVEG